MMRGLDQQRGPLILPFHLSDEPPRLQPVNPAAAGRSVRRSAAPTAAIVVEGVIAFPLDGFTVPSRCTMIFTVHFRPILRFFFQFLPFSKPFSAF